MPIGPVATVRPCPICDSRSGRLVWSEDGHSYVRCRGCGGIFSNLDEAEYERARHNVWNEETPGDDAIEFYGSARDRVHRDFLDRYPPAGNRRLLDLGCGLGFFLARARERGWNVYGIDTSPAWVKLANSRLGGTRVELATIDRASFAPESFDLITAWDVIEHIFDPVPFLAHARELLSPTGRLFIRTPNIAYGYPVYAMRRWLLRQDVELGPTNHVVYFSPRTMRRALRRAGLQAVDWTIHVPPQVAIRPRGTANRTRSQNSFIFAKNTYSKLAHAVAWASDGRVVLGSDLDVVCTRCSTGPS